MDQMTWQAVQGEYRGDFTRDSFSPLLGFSRVLMQQGRVTLDADWNEQVAILLHLTRTLAADLLGPHAGPTGAFEVAWGQNAQGEADIKIGPGHYYVNGWLCENNAADGVLYGEQPGYPFVENVDAGIEQFPFLVYLDVWERHVTGHDYPGMLEPALGADTATRAQVVWQVKTRVLPAAEQGHAGLKPAATGADWRKYVAQHLRGPAGGALKAWVAALEDTSEVEPCLIPSDAGYRGPENQLYRIEIHKGGKAAEARFKWSRNNSSEHFPVLGGGAEIRLGHIGRDRLAELQKDQWVEVVSRRNALRGEPGRLYQIGSVNRDELSVQLVNAQNEDWQDAVLRRWDFVSPPEAGSEGLPLNAGQPVEIEDGLWVQFDPAQICTTSEYWLIPARVATRDIIWPRKPNLPAADAAHVLTAHGPVHHYAPLALVKGNAAADVTSLRKAIKPAVA